ncbi:UNKNOWN [Stylonychia lemnae]|uniref:Uncharacterized protein n=1 Tax=Stylonychia lemnae TaxID=5949 RepID=A0A077ZRF4_STYLE|nr:UNKNOWN [Stylonychia lemnae]|eukprot:CDW71081.1 UNKNOWN [Stylonychia lemnae]
MSAFNFEGMKCPKDFNISLAGNSATSIEKYITVEIVQCDQIILQQFDPIKKCKQKSEIDDILKNTIVIIVDKQQYFDVDEFDLLPVKEIIKISTVNMIPEYTQNQNYKLRKELKYFQTRLDTTFITKDPQSNALVSIKYQIDENFESIERISSSFIDAISQVGGLMSIIFSVICFLTCYIQDFLYNSHLVQELFSYNERLFIHEYERKSKMKLKKYVENNTQNDQIDNSFENSQTLQAGKETLPKKQLIEQNIHKFQIKDKIDKRMAKRFLKKSQLFVDNIDNNDYNGNINDNSAIDYNPGPNGCEPVAEDLNFQSFTQIINDSQRFMNPKVRNSNDKNNIILDE